MEEILKVTEPPHFPDEKMHRDPGTSLGLTAGSGGREGLQYSAPVLGSRSPGHVLGYTTDLLPPDYSFLAV